jgi:hypothetical protein
LLITGTSIARLSASLRHVQLVGAGTRQIVSSYCLAAQGGPTGLHDDIVTGIRGLFRLQLCQNRQVGIRLRLGYAERQQCRDNRRIGSVLRKFLGRCDSTPSQIRESDGNHCDRTSRRTPKAGLY